jgi:DNA adenine methylase
VAGPFLKWAGGKGRLAKRIVEAAPAGFVRFHEPFVGGGAVFFALQATGGVHSARLVDSNRELIECFGLVRDRTDDLIARLRQLSDAYLGLDHAARGEEYLARRADVPRDPVARAARLIFLNKTCYNGLYRVNAKGLFNVPHGRYAKPRILDEEALRASAASLGCAELVPEDFETACAHARPGDFVYLDPPYFPLSATSRFTDYTSGEFGAAQHERLRDTFEDLTRRGVAAMLSNSSVGFVEHLYGNRGYRIETVSMARAINSVGTKRAPIDELLIDNFERIAASSPTTLAP